jgi:hypothetical protein
MEGGSGSDEIPASAGILPFVRGRGKSRDAWGAPAFLGAMVNSLLAALVTWIVRRFAHLVG